MHLMVADEALPIALVGSGSGSENKFGSLLGGDESSPSVLDEPSPACLAALDFNLNRFMIYYS